MPCLKCGRDISEGQVFCKSCSAVMEQYPVKPGTPVTIPVRPRREVRIIRQVKPEEQIALLQRKLRRLRIFAGVLLTALALCVGLVVFQFVTRETGPSIGQNYTSVTGPATQGGR